MMVLHEFGLQMDQKYNFFFVEKLLIFFFFVNVQVNDLRGHKGPIFALKVTRETA